MLLGSWRATWQPPSWLTKGLCLHPHTQRLKANENLGTSREPLGLGLPFIPRVSLGLEVQGSSRPEAVWAPLLGRTGRPRPHLDTHPVRPLLGRGFLFGALQIISTDNYRTSAIMWTNGPILHVSKYRSTDLLHTFKPPTTPHIWEMFKKWVT